MAITGTKYSNASKTLKNYFVNDTTITDVEVMDSQYADLSLKLLLTDDNNGYTYTCFVNQKFDKDNNGVVTGLTYPDDLNTLFVAAKCDLNVSDNGVLDTKSEPKFSTIVSKSIPASVILIGPLFLIKNVDSLSFVFKVVSASWLDFKFILFI